MLLTLSLPPLSRLATAFFTLCIRVTFLVLPSCHFARAVYHSDVPVSLSNLCPTRRPILFRCTSALLGCRLSIPSPLCVFSTLSGGSMLTRHRHICIVRRPSFRHSLCVSASVSCDGTHPGVPRRGLSHVCTTTSIYLRPPMVCSVR